MKNTNVYLGSISLLLVAVIGFLGFSNKERFSKNEYLSITVEYNFDAQLIFINEGSMKLQKVAAIPKDMVLASRKKIERKGFEILENKVEDSRLDNTEIIRLLNNYEEQGWTLNSHSMDISETGDGLFFNRTKVVQYLMTREVK